LQEEAGTIMPPLISERRHLCSNAFPDAKPVPTFAGNAFFPTHFRTQNRYPLLLEML